LTGKIAEIYNPLSDIPIFIMFLNELPAILAVSSTKEYKIYKRIK